MEFTPGTMTALFWSLMGLLAFLKSLLPQEFYEYVEECKRAWIKRWSIYDSVEVHENGNEFGHNQLYVSTCRYLGALTSTAGAVTAECPRNSAKITFSLAANGEMREDFRGCTMRWKHSVSEQKDGFAFRVREKKLYTLTVHKRDRAVLPEYLKLVLERGCELAEQDREKKLNTNLRDYWKSVPFMHPSTFDTVAMEPARKQELMADLRRFMTGKDLYNSVGRAWKRGYLLYGPPGTGKSSLIAAIANLTGYDLYDLELTKVSSNMELRQLLISISDRAIIVVEDIDCSLQFGGNRNASSEDDDGEDSNGGKSRRSQVTLSGFLNFIDGLWSCCGSQRIFIFTTNYMEKLDPALLRPGRMDVRIHMSYCTFEVFKMLSSNYLKIKEHELYPEIEELLVSVQITPADLIEVLVRQCSDCDLALENLVETLKKKKQQQQQNDSSSNVNQEVAEDEISDQGSSTSAE